MKAFIFSFGILLQVLVYVDPAIAQSGPEVDSTSHSEPLGDGDASAAAEEIGPRGPANEAKQRYGDQLIWFEDSYLGGWRPIWQIRGTLAYKGRYKQRLDGERFYRAVGRDDLANRYNARNRMRWTLRIGGIGLAIGGTAYALLGHEDCSLDAGFAACMERNKSRLTTGGVAILLGVGVVGAGYLINPHPIAAHEARALADGHNKRLRQELGLPEDYQAGPMSYRKSKHIRVSPFVTPQGGGILFSGRL